MDFKRYIIGAALGLCSLAAVAQDSETYTRSSLCSFLISRTDQGMYDRIQERFMEIPTPDQYNSHDLSIRILNVDKKGNYSNEITDWLDRHQVASRLVARWFERDILTGQCSMDLIKSRGLYNASELDRELAARSARGMAMLEDAGEELIGNTFVLVHEATYIDNAQRSKNVATGIRIVGALASPFLGSAISDLADNLADITETIKGFKVKIHTSLYQLDWSDAVSNTFYEELYSDVPDDEKRRLFDKKRDMFKLSYVGDVTSAGAQTSFMGINEDHPELMIRKACQRAIDDNVRDLQKKFEVFRVKSPILAVTDKKEVQVPIGMKEGVNPESEYEVLERQERNGRTVYKRVGVVTPVTGQIWDNRFMAGEENAVGSELRYTTFKVKSGSTPMEGQLVRQIK